MRHVVGYVQDHGPVLLLETHGSNQRVPRACTCMLGTHAPQQHEQAPVTVGSSAHNNRVVDSGVEQIVFKSQTWVEVTAHSVKGLLCKQGTHVQSPRKRKPGIAVLINNLSVGVARGGGYLGLAARQSILNSMSFGSMRNLVSKNKVDRP